jgi:REP element-mobilizing transposase RayT
MRAPFTQLYLHGVWATWDREPLVTAQIEQPVYAFILAKIRELRCVPIAIGGISDHVHVLVRWSPTVSIAEFIGEVKGGSSHFVTHQLLPQSFFKWQGSYGAFTVSRDQVESVRHYIERQKEHHAMQTVVPAWEQTISEPSDAAEPGEPGD